jgi:hypothetical protein
MNWRSWWNAVALKLALPAIGFEAASLALLAGRDARLSTLLAYFALHGLACLLAAPAVYPLLPRRYAEPRGWVLAFLFACNFFIPLASLVCGALGLVLGVWLPAFSRGSDYGSVEAPRFDTHRNHEGTGFRGGQVRAQLGNAAAPLDQRMKALVALQDTPAHATGELLRRLLADPADDIRLLAYGILDNKEKAVMSRIREAQAALDGARDDAQRHAGHKRIAELYFELIYQDLVQGDMRRFAADQVRSHIALAHRHSSDDAGLWFMLARLELQARDVAAAQEALAQAEATGFARARLLPYVAELRFLQGRHAEVRRMFAELQPDAALPAIAAMRRYWGRELTRAATSEELHR